MTLTQLLKEFPPCLCRLLAREFGEAPSSEQIAAQMHSYRDKIDAISKSTNWSLIIVDDALRFMEACGVELTNLRRQREFIRRNNWNHLTKSKNKKFYARIMQLWLQSCTKPSAGTDVT